ADQKDGIHEIADLKGKIVGIPAPGTPEGLALITLLTKAGLSSHQVMVRSYGERRLAGALEAGEGSAAVLSDPYLTRLVDAGRAVALVDFRKSNDAARWLGPSTVHAALFVRADTRLRDADLESLTRALLRAMARLAGGAAEGLEREMPAAAVGFAEDFRRRLEGARDVFIRDGSVSVGAMDASVSLVRDRSIIPAKVKMPRSADRLL